MPRPLKTERQARRNLLSAVLPKTIGYAQRAAIEVIARGGSEDEAITAAADATRHALEFWIINGIWPDEAEDAT